METGWVMQEGEKLHQAHRKPETACLSTPELS